MMLLSRRCSNFASHIFPLNRCCCVRLLQTIPESIFQKKAIVPLDIERMTPDGRAVVHVQTTSGSERIIIVEDAFPGSRVKVQLNRLMPGAIKGDVVEILRQPNGGTDPLCPIFYTCGGCSRQHLEYKVQLQLKQDQIQAILKLHPDLSDVAVKEIIGCADPWYYRNNMLFSFGTHENKTIVGLKPKGDWSKVRPVEKCYIQHEIANKILSAVSAFLLENPTISAYDNKTRKGYLRSLLIRKGSDGFMVVFVTTDQSVAPILRLAGTIKENLPEVISIMHAVCAGESDDIHSWAGSEKPLFGTRQVILENILGLKFEVSPSSFMQTNSEQTQVLYQLIKNALQLSGKEHVLDLYCGTGTIGLICANDAKSVIGVETTASSVENAKKNAEKNGITNATFVLKDAPEFMKTYRAEEDDDSNTVVIVDPPRSGLTKHLIFSILNLKPPKIVSVSCNPATHARDLALFMKDGEYEIKWVQPVDMFPHTGHVESVALMIRREQPLQRTAATTSIEDDDEEQQQQQHQH